MRRVFWNFWTAFVGWPIVKMAPQKLLKFPVIIGVPLYTTIVLQGGKPKSFPVRAQGPSPSPVRKRKIDITKKGIIIETHTLANGHPIRLSPPN